MHIKSLKIFCDVVKHRSFSKAADANGVSQSNASQVVLHLEEHLGVQLLDRSRRPFVLTPEGDRYFEGCLDLLQKYDVLEEDIRSLHEAEEARVNVASIYSVGLAHMSQYLRDFSAQNPNCNIRLEYLHPDRVREVVETEQADFGITSYPQESRLLAAVAWRDEPMVIVAPPTHPLASRGRAPLEAVRGQSFVAFQQGLRIRDEIDQEFDLRGIEVVVEFEFDNIETIKRAVEVGSSVSILPEPTVAREVALGTLVAIPLSGQQLSRPLGFVYRRNRELSGASRRFIEYLQSHADDELVLAKSVSSSTNKKTVLA
ncbi:LysR family transcriptional regulator [Aeoliella sp. ICT_H6.2]|uniref:LysR family transcriptional regulator n=1 Tax=Aeoliella straminimaris TaxID=2954799 RepID=A0A9X2JE51_9BACT|nr:LysR family transcriptional regulator [Aeoliella straminimaris]MCO6042296.1 LysR family transcriptional regulator [Aeoliella straminimaris]